MSLESSRFFCPSGKMFYSFSPSKIKEDLEKNCQCPCCDKFDFSRPDLGCSGGPAGDILGDKFNADWACKVYKSSGLTVAYFFIKILLNKGS